MPGFDDLDDYDQQGEQADQGHYGLVAEDATQPFGR